MYWLTDLETGTSKIKAWISDKGLLPASSHGRRWNGKREGKPTSKSLIIKALNSPRAVETSWQNQLSWVPSPNRVTMAIELIKFQHTF